MWLEMLICDKSKFIMQASQILDYEIYSLINDKCLLSRKPNFVLVTLREDAYAIGRYMSIILEIIMEKFDAS